MTAYSSPEGEELDTLTDPGEDHPLLLDQTEATTPARLLSKGLDDPLPHCLTVWIRHCRQTQEGAGNRTYRKRSERSIGPISCWRIISCKERATELEKEKHQQHEISRKSHQRLSLSYISDLQPSRLHVYVYRAIPKYTMKCAGVVFLRRTPRDTTRIVNY